LTKSDDAALFELWLTKKDGDAFAELARRHAPVVYDLAARAMGDRTAAEDVVQEALLDLALEPTRKPAEVGVVAWLARFAICRARNQRSSERCRVRRQLIVGLRRPEEAMPDDHLELTEELEHALAAAEPDERTVLAMRFLHGWEYDRIAQALETTEGAARVRVHRALSSVRNRLGVADADDAKVARGMAAVGLIPLSAAKLDSVITAALDAAGVPPVPTMGASRLPGALRSGLQAFGVVVLLVGAAASTRQFAVSDGGESGAETAQVLVETTTCGARAPVQPTFGDTNHTASSAVPRPENWDGGALARLASGESEFDGVDVAPPLAEPKPAAPREQAAAPAPAAAPVAANDQPPSAFRPSARGASAANCDPGSSDDERADALGGFFRQQVQEAVAERPAVAEAAPVPADETAAEPAMRRRVISRGRAFEALDASEKVVVEEAAALVRDVVAKVALDAVTNADPKAIRHAKLTSARAVKLQVREWRRQAPPDAPRISARRAARLQRLIAVLLEYALANGSSTDDLRWPDGVDVASALQDLIRVLTSVPAPVAPAQEAPPADAAGPDGAADPNLPDMR
jgi:RNA polymerase sigma-70 factor (ECF subfamily)